MTTGIVWSDASSVATGVKVDIGGDVVQEEDRFCTYQCDIVLDTVVKGGNLALKWDRTTERDRNKYGINNGPEPDKRGHYGAAYGSKKECYRDDCPWANRDPE